MVWEVEKGAFSWVTSFAFVWHLWHFWNLTRLCDKDEHKHFVYLFSLNLPLWFEIAASDILISVTTVWLWTNPQGCRKPLQEVGCILLYNIHVCLCSSPRLTLTAWPNLLLLCLINKSAWHNGAVKRMHLRILCSWLPAYPEHLYLLQLVIFWVSQNTFHQPVENLYVAVW